MTTVSVLPLVPSGIPASVLSRRPDVLASAYAVDAAGIRIGLAQEAWFPTLSLTAPVNDPLR